MSLELFTATLGIGLAVLILYLLRRDYMHTSHGLFWFAVALAAGILGAWPRLIDRVGDWFGISYSPAFLLLAAVIVLTLKALHIDSENTRLERDLRTLNQRMAVLEARLVEAEQRAAPIASPEAKEG
ncbi:DUF2304 family protein [Pseudazoarcus pumilus]|uniref:DUF2304 domain-containing protein n=1 Tax=Pseudazoarcus pumilus TaxID=2067960 RepID=A0A2I6S900_9RHOO|nr:DUF2304 family protein [Pseudazoarcus pumilus]AUN95701.1 DUF2304 domain-containing protein [Pseudazoarcus pumilus]